MWRAWTSPDPWVHHPHPSPECPDCPPAALDAGENAFASVSELGRLAALASVELRQCQLPQGALAGLRGCTALTALDVSENKELGSLAGVPTQRLVSLRAGQCGLVDLGPLAGCCRLELLHASCNPLTSLSALSSLTGDWPITDHYIHIPGWRYSVGTSIFWRMRSCYMICVAVCFA